MPEEAWNKAAHIYADLRKKHITIGDADIFIAAFCILHDCILVTENVKHFRVIDELKLENWAI